MFASLLTIATDQLILIRRLWRPIQVIEDGYRERGDVMREEEETRLTPRNLVHLVNSRLWYRLIIQSLKKDIQSSFGIIHDSLDRGLAVSSIFYIYRI